MARTNVSSTKIPKARPGGRSARVVEGILVATALELGANGYQGLSFERVAERANVNKTTVYRRWATKRDLVSAMLEQYLNAFTVPALTGDVEADLRALGQLAKSRWSSPYARAMYRLLTDVEIDELRPLMDRLHEQFSAPWHELIDTMKKRGVVRKNVETVLVIKAIVSSIANFMIRDPKAVTSKFIDRAIDMVLYGILTDSHRASQAKREDKAG